MEAGSPNFDNVDSTNVTERKRGGRSRGRSRTIKRINEDIQEEEEAPPEEEAKVNTDIKTVMQEANSAKLLSRAIKGYNARKEARQLQEIMRREKLKEQYEKDDAEEKAKLAILDPPATKINNAIRGHLARKKLMKNSEKISNLIARMDVVHDNLDKAIGDPGTGLTWETMKQRFDAATTLSKMVQRHVQMKKYNKDELILKNAKLDKVNALLDQSIQEQEKEGKSRKIKKAFLAIRKFWAEEENKETKKKAEDSIGSKVKSLQEKRKLLEEQQDKGEELYKIAQEKKAKGIGKK